MAVAVGSPGGEWDRRVVDQLIRHWASTGRPFTADDLRPELPAVATPVIGTAFMAAARRGLIERIGDAQAQHDKGHARRVGLWRGAARQEQFTIPARRDLNDERPAAELVNVKAARLLAAGRVRVRLADEDGRVVVDVHGDSGAHVVRRTAGGRWSCNCAAGSHRRNCTHVAAVALVVAR